MQAAHIGHKHSHTLSQIFQHPATHNLEWHNVVSLVSHSGTVEIENNGNMIFTMSGISEVFHHPQGKDVADIEHVLDIRRFLERAGVQKDGIIIPPSGMKSQNDGAPHSHNHGRENSEQNRDTEQKLHTQEHAQNERNSFNGGDARAHQQGTSHK